MEEQRFEDSLVREILAHERESQAHGLRVSSIFGMPFPGKAGVVPHEIAGRFPDLDAAFGATISASLRAEYGVRIPQLAAALELCESPIEARFLLGLICGCAFHDLTIIVADDDQEEIYSGKGSAYEEMTLWVFPQLQIDDHRVDFGLSLVFDNPQIKIARMVGKPDPPVPLVIENRVVVECDGHAFHEQTPEQAARDKSRDRDLLNRGYPVMRFTGSEIVSGPLKCAGHVMDWVFDKKSEFGQEIWK